MSTIRRIFTRENIGGALRRLGVLRVKVSHAALFELTLLILIITLAFTIRLLPIRWGYYLSEFDPYYQYRITKHITEEGIFSFTNWRDYMSWWPYGRDVPHTSFPGLAVTAATLYTILNALGVPMAPPLAANPLYVDPIYNFVIIFPLIMASLTCIAIYFLGKDIGGKETGLFAAFFLAINAAYIGRTTLGFFDDETVGIFGILIVSLFFLRAIESDRPWKQTLLYGIASGLSLGYLYASWGASRYAAGLLLVLVFVMLLLRRYSPNLLLAYGSTFFTALFIAINVPYLGQRFATEITNLIVFGLFLILVAIEVSRRIRRPKMKILFNLGFFSLLIALFFALSWYGYVGRLEAKFLAVVNPFERLLFPIVESVQEHRPAAWGSIYYDVGIGIFFIPVGLFFAAQNPTNRNIFLILFGLTSVYFASSMVRLTLIMAPALCLLWALALTRVLRPFITVMKETPTTIRRKMRFETHVGKEFSIAFLILIFLLFTFTFVFPSTESRTRGASFPRVFDQAYVPTTMASAGIPVKPSQPITDWIDALNWMRNNLPQDAVVASWWDYGYWITTVADRPSLADNGTFNWTQIGRIATMFMSNETEAAKILSEDFNSVAHRLGKINNVTHVLVFTTFDNQGNDIDFGDESKWIWMAKIAGLNETEFATTQRGNDNWTQVGRETVIYKLMDYVKGPHGRQVKSDEPTLTRFELVYFSNMNRRDLWSKDGINAVVAIYEVKY